MSGCGCISRGCIQEFRKSNQLHCLELPNQWYHIISSIGLSLSPIALDFSANKFIGVFPIKVWNLKNLEYFDTFENMLFGKIPTSLGSCVKLEFLAMRSNFFQGAIPSSFESLRGLQVLDFSKNDFSENIPKFLESFIFL